jgi:hypothetical protein
MRQLAIVGLSLLFLAGCVDDSILDSNDSIQPGLYTGTLSITKTVKDQKISGTTEQTTTESQITHIQINNDNTISFSGRIVAVGDTATEYIGEYQLITTITGVVFDNNKILITYTKSGEWIDKNSGDTATISGYSTELYTINQNGTLSASLYQKLILTSGTEFIYMTTESTGTLSQ